MDHEMDGLRAIAGNVGTLHWIRCPDGDYCVECGSFLMAGETQACDACKQDFRRDANGD